MGPDPENIVLVLKAQSILFKRYKEGMTAFQDNLFYSLDIAPKFSYVLPATYVILPWTPLTSISSLHRVTESQSSIKMILDKFSESSF